MINVDVESEDDQQIMPQSCHNCSPWLGLLSNPPSRSTLYDTWLTGEANI